MQKRTIEISSNDNIIVKFADVFLACLAIGLAALLLELTKTVRINLRLLYPVQRRANRDATRQSTERTPLLGPSLVVNSAGFQERKRRYLS